MRTVTPADTKRENAFRSHPQRYYRPSASPLFRVVHQSSTAATPPPPPAPAEWKHLVRNTDPHNTTVFVGGLDPLVGRETVKAIFAPFGEIQHVRLFLPTRFVSHIW
jgi:hypothetical protein